MFFGLLNLTTLSECLPVEIDGQPIEDMAKKREYLESMSTALTCPDYLRVFASRHASIKHMPGKQIKSFGCLLDPEQEAVCDKIEQLGIYYEKIRVQVVLHSKDGVDQPSEAYVYRMLDSFVQQDVENGLTHNDDEYVHLCAETDLMHY